MIKIKVIKISIYFLLIPLIILIGVFLFNDKQYYLVSILVTVLSLVPFIYRFEKSKSKTSEIILLGAITALSVFGRFIFAGIPGFKPVSAIIILGAIYFGSEFGFISGALSAFISNFGFGQGPWTPFQMFAWGMIGFIAGVFKKYLREKQILLYIYAFLSGGIYSLFVDVWSVIWLDNEFNITRYLASVVSSLPFMLIYSVSNIVFIFLLKKPIDKAFMRLINKYGIYK